MKTKRPTFAFAANQLNLLAAGIFVLWSVGVIILPALGESPHTRGFGGSIGWVGALYIVLHVVIFIFTSLMLWKLFSRARHLGTSVILQGALYVYVLAALATSLYLIFGAAIR